MSIYRWPWVAKWKLHSDQTGMLLAGSDFILGNGILLASDIPLEDTSSRFGSFLASTAPPGYPASSSDREGTFYQH